MSATTKTTMDLKSIKNAGFGGMTEKNKQWRMEALIEQLRTKNLHNKKNFTEMAKGIRMSLLEKRYALDAVEKAHLQKTLDSMQHCIRVTSRQGLVERLESLTRQLGLKFTDNSNSLFISSDMFYLEILLNASTGSVHEVKVHHECNVKQESCQELVAVLKSGDFNDFTQQLEGFQSIYQLNAESKIKSKAFVALQALEMDLISLYKFENQNQKLNPEQLILKSSVGILLKRRGGHAMRLFFFVRPHELLNFSRKKVESMTTDFLLQAVKVKKEFGYSATINLEGAAPANKLQVAPIFNSQQSIGKSSPVYLPISSNNSTMLPATFVLRLNKPLPCCVKIIEKIKLITDMNIFGSDGTPLNAVSVKQESNIPNDPLAATKPASLINLLVQFESENTYTNGDKGGLFVSFPDQNHCYFLSDQNEIMGLLIKNIQFTEPAHVTKIIKLLRQQALFNALIASCIRLGKQDLENMYIFEVNAVTINYMQIFVEHPFIESIVTLELDLSELTQLSCKIFYGDKRISENTEKYAMKILQLSFSIPIMLRALIKLWEKDFKNSSNSYSSFPSSCGDEQKFSLNNSLLNVDKIRDAGDDEMDGTDKNGEGAEENNKKESNKRGDKDSKKDNRKNSGKDHDNHDDDNFGNGGANGNGNGGSNSGNYGNSRSGQYNNSSGSKDTQNTKNDNSGGKKSGNSVDKLLTSDPTGIFENSSSSFDICGVNKNEIFFKTDQNLLEPTETPTHSKGHSSQSHHQQKITLKRVHDNDFDIFDVQRNKKGLYEENIQMDYDFDEEDDLDEEEEEEEEEDVMNANYINENSSSSSSDASSSSTTNSSSSNSEASNKKNKKMLNTKKNLTFASKNSTSSPTTKAKPLDVFEFTPSPPPPSSGSTGSNLTTPLPLTSPSDSKNSSPLTTSHLLSNLENNRIHDIEIIPLKGQTNTQGEPITNPPTSITITPINSNYFSKDKKSSLSVDEKLKKKKRKREDEVTHKKSSSSTTSSSIKKEFKKKEYSSKNLSTPGSSEKSKETVKKSPSIDPSKLENSPKTKFNNKLKVSAIEDLTMDPDPSMYSFTNDEKMMLMSMNAQQGNQSSSQSLMANLKNRKGSALSAVIDKLKSAQTVSDEFGLIEGLVDESSQGGSRSLNMSAGQSSSGSGKETGQGKNTEYQIKSTGGDGFKITINKTKSSSSLGSCSPSTSSSSSKTSSSSSKTSLTSSPKHHTGLKPGVNSGPLSKKSLQLNNTATSQNMSQKLLYQKSSSSGNIGSSSSKSSSSSSGQKQSSFPSSKSSTNLLKEKSKSSGSQERSGSPYSLPSSITSSAEQFLKAAKTFHIPKISRNNGGSGTSGSSGSSSQKTSSSSGKSSSTSSSSKDDVKTSSSSSQQKSSQYSSAPSTPVSNLNASPESAKGNFQGNSAMQTKRPSSTIPGSSSSSSDKTKKLLKSSSSEQLFVAKPKKIKDPSSGSSSLDSQKISPEDLLNSLARSGVQASTTASSLANHMKVLNDMFKQQEQKQIKPEVKNDERRTPTAEFDAKTSAQRLQNFSPSPQLYQSSPSPQQQQQQSQVQQHQSPSHTSMKPIPPSSTINLFSDSEI